MTPGIGYLFLTTLFLGLAANGCSRSGHWSANQDPLPRQLQASNDTPKTTPSNTPPPKTDISNVPPKSPPKNREFNYDGRVVGIVDGDTVDVLDTQNQTHRVRLAGIDAPESGQDFGKQSKITLSSLVFGKGVVVTGNKYDRYGRQLGKILLMGEDINLMQIRSGLAWHFKKFQKEQSAADIKLYSDAEVTAREAKAGIWSLPNPIPPWEFR